MTLRFFKLFLANAVLFTAFVAASVAAQGPTQVKDKTPLIALERLAEQQEKLAEQRLREKVPPADVEAETERQAEIIRQAAQTRAAQFKLADWQNEELLALGRLHAAAENFAEATAALDLYLKRDAFKRTGNRERLQTVTAAQDIIEYWLEMDRVTEAADEFQRLESMATTLRDLPQIARSLGPSFLPRQAELARLIATGWFEHAAYDKTVTVAQAGYAWAKKLDFVGEELPLTALGLAAQVQAALERQSKTKEAAAWRAQLDKELFKAKPELLGNWLAELTFARLVGQSAPELVAARWLNGAPVKLAAWSGKVVLLDFWAMWCAPCWRAFPHLRTWQKQFAAKGLELVGVTRFYGRSDEKEDLNRDQELQELQRFLAKQQLAYVHAVAKLDDVTNEERYGVTSLPTTLLLDRRGKVRIVQRGGVAYRKLGRQIARLLAEPAASTTN